MFKQNLYSYRKFPLTALFFLIVFLITYASSLPNQYMIDDFAYTQMQSRTINLPDFFLKTSDHHYNPLDKLINTFLFSHLKTPSSLRFFNITLLYIITLLIFLLIRMISARYSLAFLSSILFAIHPMNAEIIYHNTFGPPLISYILMLLALLSVWQVQKDSLSLVWHLATLICFVLSLLTLELALLFPLYAFYLLYFVKKFPFKKAVQHCSPYFLTVAAFLLLWTKMAAPQAKMLERFQFHQTDIFVFTASLVKLAGWYLKNLFVPEGIVFMYNIPAAKESIFLLNVILVAILGLVAFLIYSWKSGIKTFALLVFLSGFLLVIPGTWIRPRLGYVFEPYWMFFSILGFFILLADSLLLLRRKFSPAIFFSLIVSLCLFFWCYTYSYNQASRSELIYNQNWLRKSPHNNLAMMTLSTLYIYQDNLKIPTEFLSDMREMTLFYEETQTYSRAIDLLHKIIQSSPREEINDRILLATLYWRDGKHTSAEEIILPLLAETQYNIETYLLVANAFTEKKEYSTALFWINQAKQRYPGNKEVYLLGGVILANEKKYQEAIEWWGQGLSIDPMDQRFTQNVTEAQRLLRQ